MTIQYGTPNSSTSSIGKVTFLTATAVAFALGGSTAINQGFHALDASGAPQAETLESLILLHNWEARLRGSDSSGGENLYLSDSANFSQLYAFASSLHSDQADVPEEFNKLFKKTFWDILA